jgi:hypothetical protein
LRIPLPCRSILISIEAYIAQYCSPSNQLQPLGRRKLWTVCKTCGRLPRLFLSHLSSPITLHRVAVRHSSKQTSHLSYFSTAGNIYGLRGCDSVNINFS